MREAHSLVIPYSHSGLLLGGGGIRSSLKMFAPLEISNPDPTLPRTIQLPLKLLYVLSAPSSPTSTQVKVESYTNNDMPISE